MKVAALWSGGKDSCLASYEANLKGFEISNLLNFIFKDASRKRQRRASDFLSNIYRRVERRTPNVASNLLSLVYKDLSRMVPHEIAPEIITMQAQAMEKPLVQRETNWDTFEYHLKSIIGTLKRTGIEGLVYGIDPPYYPLNSSEKLKEHSTFMAHKDWIHRICSELDIKPITPLLGRNPDQILADFVDKGFEAIIVVVDSNLLGEEWLGRKLNHEFLYEVQRLNRPVDIHASGSAYHTLVTDGPLFRRRLNILQSRKVQKTGYTVLAISRIELAKKAMV